MATKTEPDYPSSPPNDESDGEGHESPVQDTEDKKPVNNNVADILKRLQTSGALIKKPKQEYHCFTCDKDYSDWEDLENHLIQHVQLPSVVLDKLPSDDEDIPDMEDEDWSDDEENSVPPTAPGQKIDISQILKKTGLSLKKPEPPKTSETALNKLSGLGFTIKKNVTLVKNEPVDDKPNDLMQKLGKLGGIKLKLKSDGGNTNSFKVINGLKDFQASDDEFEDEGEEKDTKVEENDSDAEEEKSGEHDDFPDDELPLKDKPTKVPLKITGLQSLKGKSIAKIEPTTPPKVAPANGSTSKDIPNKPAGRPLIKQTPKRGANLPLPVTQKPLPPKTSVSSSSTPERSQSQERRQSHEVVTENVVVKKEVDNDELDSTSAPLFSGEIKTERTSPPPIEIVQSSVKSEPEPVSANQTDPPIFSDQARASAPSSVPPLLPITKTEDTGVTVIEINGDSNDEDDDCCVVSATPAPDVKPVVPKAEPPSSYPLPAYPATSQMSYSSPITAHRSTEKQHSFNWNAPDSKPAIDMLEKSADDIFESLLSSSSKKDGLSDASEYISLDTLGPKQSCEVCNTRFTDIGLLEAHIRVTGHSRSLVTAPSSASLMPYNSSSSILQSLLPVKHMVEQVGKMSGMNSGPGFTHQQNVMINIQAYPGSGGVMGPPQSPYSAYSQGQNMSSPYGQSTNMYGQQIPTQHMPGPHNMPGHHMPGMPDQFSNQNYMGQQGFGQFQQPMSKPGYPGQMGQNPYDSSSYPNQSPLQGMQQAVYGQTPTSMNSQIGQMGPPPVPPANQYVPSSSPGGSTKPTSSNAIRIQNVQTFPPGQIIGMSNQGGPSGPEGAATQSMAPGQMVGGQMPAPNQIRMAPGANVSGPRPRMPNVRGQRPNIRPNLQVNHGNIRGLKPRMPMKRPGNVAPNPTMKKRPNILLPMKHDNEDCQVMSMQKQREGMPLIHSVQGANDKLNIGSGISITKKKVNPEANAMANVLASRGISIKQKPKSRSPSPERPVPHIPNLGAGVSIKHSSKPSKFSIPEAKVGGGMISCKICKKMFMNHNSLAVHMSSAHPQSKMPMFKCEECPASYPKILQLQHHKRVFHNAVGQKRELGLPVIDVSQEDNVKRLNSLGIYSFIPLAGREGDAGCFGIPVISVHNVHNGMSSALQSLGADGLLSLGPIKSFPS